MLTEIEKLMLSMLSAKENKTDTINKKISARELRLEKLKMRAIVDANELKWQQRKKI
jgi:hypothetical protein